MTTRHLPLLLTSIFLAACGSVVSDGGGSANNLGTTSSGAGGSGGSGPVEELLPAVSLTRAQMDVLWDEYWATHDPSGTTVGSGGGDDLDPNDLFLRVSDQGVSCGSPTAQITCGGHYELSIVLPAAFQQVGVYDLEDPELIKYSHMSETGDLNSADPSDCPGGGGSIGAGTLEIISIDATEVHFKVNVTGGPSSENPSGEYTAPRCAPAS